MGRQVGGPAEAAHFPGEEVSMDVFEAIYTLRAIRRFKPDPVPDELVWKVLEAATKAPSGGNRQPWRFLVIRDPETKARIGQFYLEGWERFYGPNREQMLADPERAPIYRSADHLARHMGEVPVHHSLAGDHLRPRLLHLSGRPEPAAGRPRPGPGGRPHHPAPGAGA